MAKVLLVIASLCFFGCGSLDSFLFNSRAQDKYNLPGNTIPDSLLTHVTFKSGNNTLHGFWVKSDGSRPGITLLYCHGNKHGIDEYWDRVMFLHGLGINLFIYDYRGYGMSEGESSEKGLREDGEAALQLIRSNYGVPDDSLCLYGYSLGCYPAIYLAGLSGVKARRLFAECPFASANSLTQGSLSLDIPGLWLTDGAYDNAVNVKTIQSPLLLFHGEKDDFVRYRDNGRVVFENAPDPKDLKVISGANHDDIPQVMGIDNYRKAIRDWIDAAL